MTNFKNLIEKYGFDTILAVAKRLVIIKNLFDIINEGSNVLNNFISSNIDKVNNYNFDEFPLNLLPDINTLIILEIIFAMSIINVFIVSKLIQLDLIKYLPNNHLGKTLKFMLNRYINI